MGLLEPNEKSRRLSRDDFSASSPSETPAVSLPGTSPPSEPLVVEDQTRLFATQVQAHDLALRGYLRSKFPSIDTDDIVQESYFRLCKARAKRKIELSKAYLFAVARNTARTFL